MARKVKARTKENEKEEKKADREAERSTQSPTHDHALQQGQREREIWGTLLLDTQEHGAARLRDLGNSFTKYSQNAR